MGIFRIRYLCYQISLFLVNFVVKSIFRQWLGLGFRTLNYLKIFVVLFGSSCMEIYLPTIHESLIRCQNIPFIIDVVQLMKPSYTLVEISLRPCNFGTILVFHLTLTLMRMICIIGCLLMRLSIMTLLFLICCWMIWKSHDKESFKDNSRSLWNILSQINTRLHSTKQDFCGSNKISSPKLVSWNSTPENGIKVKVDGSSIGNIGSSDFYCLLRNSSRGWITGFGGSCGSSSNINVELQVISHGLDIAWNHWFQKCDLQVWFSNGSKVSSRGCVFYSSLCAFGR